VLRRRAAVRRLTTLGMSWTRAGFQHHPRFFLTAARGCGRAAGALMSKITDRNPIRNQASLVLDGQRAGHKLSLLPSFALSSSCDPRVVLSVKKNQTTQHAQPGQRQDARDDKCGDAGYGRLDGMDCAVWRRLCWRRSAPSIIGRTPTVGHYRCQRRRQDRHAFRDDDQRRCDDGIHFPWDSHPGAYGNRQQWTRVLLGMR
jgi:hypothetical protein